MRRVVFSSSFLMMLVSSGHAELSVLGEADHAYAQREDLAQANRALEAYEKNALLVSSESVESCWKAARTAWWVGQNTTRKADRLAVFQRGIDAAQKAIATDSQSVEAHFWLAANWGSFGEAKGVLKSLSLVKPIRAEMDTVLRLKPDFMGGAAYHVLGAIDYKVPGMMGGNRKRAKEELEKALALSPNDPFVHYYLSDYYRVTGDRTNALREQQALHTLVVSPESEPERRMLESQLASSP